MSSVVVVVAGMGSVVVVVVAVVGGLVDVVVGAVGTIGAEVPGTDRDSLIFVAGVTGLVVVGGLVDVVICVDTPMLVVVELML
ncbi:MAG: hypothetical protein VX963_01430 [Actinomycetota bacterium]|nr:hypothetical protein [Actinomycetota bacterium]